MGPHPPIAVVSCLSHGENRQNPGNIPADVVRKF